VIHRSPTVNRRTRCWRWVFSRQRSLCALTLVIQGAEDFTTPTSLARALVNRIEAPHKAFVTIKGGHFAVFMNSSDFLRDMQAGEPEANRSKASSPEP
jgi:pimeloyl-ACP methyl ester carboxylesterase